MDYLSLSYNTYPVCPTCKKEMSDPWELNLNDGDVIEIECGWCEAPMRIICDISVVYSTEAVEEVRGLTT